DGSGPADVSPPSRVAPPPGLAIGSSILLRSTSVMSVQAGAKAPTTTKATVDNTKRMMASSYQGRTVLAILAVRRRRAPPKRAEKPRPKAVSETHCPKPVRFVPDERVSLGNS